MTTLALPAQDTAIQNLSQDLFGDRWYVSDTYQHEPWTRAEAAAMLDRLHVVQSEGHRLPKADRLEMLRKLMSGYQGVISPLPDPPVEELIPEPDLTALRKALDEAPATNSSPISTGLVVDVDGLSDHDTTAVKTALEGLGYEPYQPKSETVTQPPIDFVIPDAQPEEETLATRKPRALKPIVHGDRKGYQAHRRRGEEPCEDCKVGNRRDQAKYRKPSTTPRKKTKPRATSARSGNPTQVVDARLTADTSHLRQKFAALSGDLVRMRYLNLLLTLAESQEVPDPALLDKIDKLIGIAL